MSPSSIIHPIGQPFIELITVDSTNNYAMAQIQKGEAQHGWAWFAYSQTAGKGQRGKQWHSVQGQNIILSVALDTNRLPVSGQFYLSAAIALAVHSVFSKYAGSESRVKWPNDIYWNDRKAGGILIENIIRGNKWQWAIAGTGININQTTFGDGVDNAVSLKQITGKDFHVIALAKEICAAMDVWFARLQTNRDAVLLEYNNILYKRGKTVQLRKGNIVFNATIKEVLPDGRLRVEDAAWDAFEFGEISWMI